MITRAIAQLQLSGWSFGPQLRHQLQVRWPVPSPNEAADELTLLRELVANLHVENSFLRQKIEVFIRRVFGSSSEKIDSAQLESLLKLAPPVAETAVAAAEPEPLKDRPAKQQRRPRIPENLPVVEQVIEPKEVAEEPGQWRLIGQEVSEQLDYEPARSRSLAPATSGPGPALSQSPAVTASELILKKPSSHGHAPSCPVHKKLKYLLRKSDTLTPFMKK